MLRKLISKRPPEVNILKERLRKTFLNGRSCLEIIKTAKYDTIDLYHFQQAGHDIIEIIRLLAKPIGKDVLVARLKHKKLIQENEFTSKEEQKAAPLKQLDQKDQEEKAILPTRQEVLMANVKEEPDELICPLTQELFKRPGLTPCGHYFDMGSQLLTNHVDGKHNCPTCREPLRIEQVIEDDFLKKTVAKFSEDQLAVLKNIDRLILPVDADKQVDDFEVRTQARLQLLPSDAKQADQRYRDLLVELVSIVPPEFKSVITQDVMVNAVMFSCGHHIDAEHVNAVNSICPCCRHDFAGEAVFPDHELNAAIAEFNNDSHLILDIIKVGEIPNGHLFNAHEEMRRRSALKISELPQNLAQRNAHYLKLYIQERVAALKLDINNIEHLQFWSQHTKRGVLGGGHEIGNYHIPTRVHQMMLVVQEPFASKQDFLAALDRVRQTRPSGSNLFSFVTRVEVTKMLYESRDIESIDFRVAAP